MQATQAVCPKPTEAQIQSQITNLRWQEKQTELANAFNRQQVQASNSLQQTRMQIEHEHYMVGHLVEPLAPLGALAIAACAVVYLVRKAIAAGIEKNRNDNEAAVLRAQEILAERAAE